MTNKICILFIVFFMSFSVGRAKAQVIGTQNLGFEKGNFDGWEGYGWTYSTASDVAPSFNTSPALVSLPSARRHVIISDQSAYDSNTGNKLKMIPEGYAYSARLGDELISSDGSPRCWQQSLKHTISVDSSNAFLLLKFACVLEYSAKHDNVTEMEPRFQLTLYDRDGKDINDCSNYQAFASGDMEAEFNTYSSGTNGNSIKWRDWTTVGADLSEYIGQDITIEFLSADCTGHYHFGYAYFVVDCTPLYITVDYCTDDTYALLEAPNGFEDYVWYEADSITIVDSGQYLEILNPNEGDLFYCVMNSETGCEVSLSSTIARYEPKADFSSKMIDCFSNEVEFANKSTTNTGDLSYLWLLGNDTTISSESFTYKFETSGMHDIGLIVYNPPSGCTDTIYKTIESFSPPLVGFSGDTTYCPDMDTELTAFGAISYEWSSGELNKSVSYAAPGGKYWMLGYSTPEEGCVSDTIHFSISEEPDWSFTLIGDSILCEGDTLLLHTSGAVNYQWDTGDSTSYIELNSGGSYNVVGKNARGCVKELGINVLEVQKPNFDFSVQPNTVNRRYNEVECKAESNDNVDYGWDMADGTSIYSHQFNYKYSIGSELISYPITVTATNYAGCFTSQTTTVYVEPFVPNVFTPDHDGINDLFMPGFQLKIFDRHLLELYTGEDGWDGYYKGQETDPDTYFYQLNYTDAYGQKQFKKGFIMLVR